MTIRYLHATTLVCEHTPFNLTQGKAVLFLDGKHFRLALGTTTINFRALLLSSSTAYVIGNLNKDFTEVFKKYYDVPDTDIYKLYQ